MPLTELESKEALRRATDWLVQSDLPGSAAAREGIASVIPLVIMGEIVPADVDELAALVEEYGLPTRDPNVPAELHLAQLKEAVGAAFDHVKKG